MNNLINRVLLTTFVIILSSFLIIGCSDDPVASNGNNDIENGDNDDDTPAIELTAEEAVQMLYEYFVELGMIPENSSSKMASTQSIESFEGDKFFEVDESDTGDFVLRLFFGPDGSIIPNADWFTDNPNFCTQQYRLKRETELILEIEVDLSEEVLRMNLLNAETNESIKSHEGVILPGEDWFIALITEMFNEFEDENILGAFESECGLFEGSISIFFDSKMEADATSPEIDFPVTINTAVHAEIELEFFEENNLYTGQATLSHRLYENSIIDIVAEAGVDCDVELTESIMRVELDVEEFATISDLELFITAPTNGEEAPWATISCEGFDVVDLDFPATFWFASFVLFHQDHVDEEREAFRFTDMQEGDALVGLLSYLEFERSMDLTDFDSDFEGQESLPVTETTRIEIWRTE